MPMDASKPLTLAMPMQDMLMQATLVQVMPMLSYLLQP